MTRLWIVIDFSLQDFKTANFGNDSGTRKMAVLMVLKLCYSKMLCLLMQKKPSYVAASGEDRYKHVEMKSYIRRKYLQFSTRMGNLTTSKPIWDRSRKRLHG